MVALTLRSVKGSALTHAEVDENFTNLQAALNDAGGLFGQIAYVFDDTPFETALSTYIDVPGLTVTLTPASAASRFLVLASISGDHLANSYAGFVRLLRNGTEVLSADPDAIVPGGSSAFLNVNSGGNAQSEQQRLNFGLDEPATASPLTYQIQARTGHGINPTFINQSRAKTSGTNQYPGSGSKLLVLEVL